jgi:hypothetical protein
MQFQHKRAKPGAAANCAGRHFSRLVKRTLFYIFAGAACVLPLGCMHTVISGGGDECWSPGDGRYHVGVSAHGAGGRAYTDLTDKRIDLSITSVDRRNQVSTLLSRELRLRAADLVWRVRWQGSQLVHVTFTDDQPVQGTSKRVVGAYSFAYDAATNAFREVPR